VAYLSLGRFIQLFMSTSHMNGLGSPRASDSHKREIRLLARIARSSGFVDDSRAFASIPARHDVARRANAPVLARLVTEHWITEDRAADIIDAIGDRAPRLVLEL
jgi:glucuronate isomerase